MPCDFAAITDEITQDLEIALRVCESLVRTSDEPKRVVTTGLANFFGAFATDWAGAMAFCSLAMLPPLVVFILAQRQVIAGLTTGGTKG